MRTRILSYARLSVGLSAAPEHLDAFEHRLGRLETPAMRHGMATAPNTSTCGLFVRGIFLDAGVDDPHLLPPYRIGHAIHDLETHAKAHGAWIDARAERRPRPGDVVFLESAGGGHVFFAEELDADAIRMTSIDAGQLDSRGRQMVARKDRTWRVAGGSIFDSSRVREPKGIDGYGERRVRGWIDVDRLPVRVNPDSFHTVADAVQAGAASIHVERPIEGIDVSELNGAIDWAGVASDVQFAYIRALVGRDDVDTLLRTNAPNAGRARCRFGLYGVLYPRAGRPQDTDVQARQLAKLHRDVGAELRPMIDVEHVKGDERVTGAEWLAAIRLYVSTLRSEGLKPILYTGPAWWLARPELVAAADLGSLDLWLAAYLKTMPPPPKPFAKVKIWQRLGSAPGFIGACRGVKGAVDRNTLFGRVEDLHA